MKRRRVSSVQTQTRARRPSRREFVKSVALGAAASGLSLAGLSRAPLYASTVTSDEAANRKRKKIALVATEVRKFSHAQHFIDRFLEGYGWHGTHHFPPMDLVSLYVDQFPPGDLARDRERRHDVRIYPSIAEALTLGGEKLAVDGVVIIAEHGRYPSNDKGQKLYPRHAWFKEVVRVFENSGRVAPVFNDKHLSTDWGECVEMVAEARRLDFPFLAGSSLPVTWRIPALEIPYGAPMEESVCVCYGGVDSYDIHGLEAAQCMSERRLGGEAGIRSVHALKGERMWKRLAESEATQELVLAALSRSHTLKPRPGYTCGVADIEWARECSPDAVAYFVEHLDGFRTTLVMANGLVSDFNYAGRLAVGNEVVSCQMYLPMPPTHTTLADFFNPLVNNIEQLILSGEEPYPAERTLITSGMTLFGVESLYRGEVKLLTPEMNTPYRANQPSTFWRA